MSASEQTSASKRQPGYYHIEYKGYECIALYDPAVVDNKTFEPTEWALPSRCVPDDKHVKVIDSRRIERPSPQQQPDTPTWSDIEKYHEEGKPLGQPDELSKAQADNRRWQESVANEYIKEIDRLEDELSKAHERIAELESENRDLRKLTDELLKGHE